MPLRPGRLGGRGGGRLGESPRFRRELRRGDSLGASEGRQVASFQARAHWPLARRCGRGRLRRRPDSPEGTNNNDAAALPGATAAETRWLSGRATAPATKACSAPCTRERKPRPSQCPPLPGCPEL